tara:strand:- start:587 stop:1699 length:1113 start_codon:yes stop_codon:yes gene_type:complete
MSKLNLIIILIDGGRLDYVQDSKFYNKLKEKFSFISNSVTYAPHTIASMHAVFSGCYGNRTGTNSYWSTFKFQKENFKSLTEYLHGAGYHTVCDMVSSLIIPKQGFDEFLIHDEEKDDLIEKHCQILDRCKEKENFFAFFQFSNIHTGIMNEVLKVYDNFSPEYFNNKEVNRERYNKLFKKSEDYLDKVLEKISSLHLDENSLILIMSDHGVSIGEKIGERAYGALCYDYTLRTFGLIGWPNMKNIQISQQVRTIDFMPTILEILNMKIDNSYEKLDGISLLPLFNDEKIEERLAFSETGNPLKEKKPPKEPNTSSIRSSKWKLIINEHDNTKELYNLELDPDENNNIIGTGLEIENSLEIELNKIRKKV